MVAVLAVCRFSGVGLWFVWCLVCLDLLPLGVVNSVVFYFVIVQCCLVICMVIIVISCWLVSLHGC